MSIIYPWQEPQWQQVSSYVKDERFPHALLLAGPKDMGKLSFAGLLAKCLLCQREHADKINHEGPACGACRSCQLAEKNNHPDFFLIQPEVDSGLIKIEQIRGLVEALGQTGQQGGRQVVIIEPAEAMNRAAANALLKTLEEPPGAIVFLLVSHQPGLLPPTIMSRCQKLNFLPPPKALSLSWLKGQAELLTASEAELDALLHMAENIPLRAMGFYNNDLQANYHKIVEALLKLYTRELQPLAMAGICTAVDFTTVFNVLWLTNLSLLQFKLGLVCQQPLLVEKKFAALFLQASQQVTCFTLFQLMEKLQLLKKQVIADKINLNLQLMFEALFGSFFQ